MNDKLEIKGYWWLPSNPDKTVAGILTYIPTKSIKLELFGSLEDEDNLSVFTTERQEMIILGATSDAKDITLINNFRSISLNFSAQFPIIRYSCQYLIVGGHINGLDDARFFKSVVRLPLLGEWCPPSQIHTPIFQGKDEQGNKGQSVTIQFSTQKDQMAHIDIDSNTTLTIEGEVMYQGDHFEPQFSQYTFLQLNKKNKSSIKDFLKDIFLFEQFLSIATLDSVLCSKILLFDDENYQEYTSGDKYYHPIELIYVQREYLVPKIKKAYDFLFDFKSIKDDISYIIKKWYTENSDIAPIRQHLVESIKPKRVFSSTDFLIVIQAIEGFYYRFRRDDNESLRNVLSNLISEFSDIDILNNNEINISQVVDSRHYYSHFMNKSKKTNALDGWELYKLTKQIRLLLICCVLNFMGFDNSAINMILKQSYNSLLE